MRSKINKNKPKTGKHTQIINTGPPLPPIPTDSEEELEDMLEKNPTLNCLLGRSRMPQKDPEAQALYNTHFPKLVNLSSTEYIIEQVTLERLLNLNNSDKGPHKDQLVPPKSTKKYNRKKQKKPFPFESSQTCILQKNWISIYDLCSYEDTSTVSSKRVSESMRNPEELQKMKRVSLELSYYDYLNKMSNVFAEHGTQYQPDAVFEMIDRIRQKKKLDSCKNPIGYRIAINLLKATFCKGPAPTDGFLFQRSLFDEIFRKNVDVAISSYYQTKKRKR